MLTNDGGFSCLYVSGHLDVVKALLEAGGRELVMLTKGDGGSCHYVSAENGHVDVVNALLEAGVSNVHPGLDRPQHWVPL